MNTAVNVSPAGAAGNEMMDYCLKGDKDFTS